jgi:hypothetical protein
LIASLILFSVPLFAQDKIVWSDPEKPVVEQLHGLRKLDDRGARQSRAGEFLGDMVPALPQGNARSGRPV